MIGRALGCLRAYPLPPLRESVLAIRSSTQQDRHNRDSLVSAHFHQMATLYDPHGDQVTELPTDDPAHLGLADLMPRAIGKRKRC